MTTTKRRRNENRTETLTVRLTQRSQWMIDIAARIYRRTLSSFVSVAAEDYAAQVMFRDGQTIGEAMDNLWHPNPTERLLRLAHKDRSLLSFEEDLVLVGSGKLPDQGDHFRTKCEAAVDGLIVLLSTDEDELSEDTRNVLKALHTRLGAILEADPKDDNDGHLSTSVDPRAV